MGALAVVAWAVLEVEPHVAIYVGAGVFLVYSFGSRTVIASDHRAGIRLAKDGDFGGAIAHFQRSYDFFRRHAWVDEWRSLTMLSSGQASYREMALVNIAFCHAQTGDGDRAEAFYRRALAEYPGSVLARTALQMADSFRSRP